jgi:fatty acid desaturase
MLFNNGYHTIHHHKAGLHWSQVPEVHSEFEHNINPILLERSFWWYIFRSYILSIFIPKFRTNSMRLERMRKEEIIRNNEKVKIEKLQSDVLLS